MELPLGCSYGHSRYTCEADASTAHEPEAAAGAGDLRPARVGVPEEKYKRNALRHSFGRYRMERVKKAGEEGRDREDVDWRDEWSCSVCWCVGFVWLVVGMALQREC